jgi:hypothetical protein
MTAGQKAVLRAVEKYGPITDAALVPLMQHLDQQPMSSSGIRSRRAELVDAGLVQSCDTIRMPSGRLANVWKA